MNRLGCRFASWIRLGCCRLREVAIVLFKGDCSQHIPSRGTAHDSREQLCRGMSRQTRTYLVRIPRRKGHSIQRVVLPGFSHFLAEAAASTVTFELAQTGGISSCDRATQIEQPGRILVRHVSFLLRCDPEVIVLCYHAVDLGGG
jgi:hypothetical protein